MNTEHKQSINLTSYAESILKEDLELFAPEQTATGFLNDIIARYSDIADASINTAIMRIVDRDKLSKVSSLTSIGSQGMIPIASVLSGAILEAFGSSVLLAFCSLGFTVTSVSLLFSREFKEL